MIHATLRTAAVVVLVIASGAVADDVPQGWMGMGLVRHVDANGRVFLFVERVLEDGPARRAGIVSGAIIVQIDGRPVTFKSDLEVLNFCRTLKPGRRLRLTVARGQQTKVVVLVVEPFPKEYSAQWRALRDSAAKDRQ